MAYLLLKALITALVFVGVSEIGKRSSLVAAVLASLPLTTILAMIWLHSDTKDLKATTALSNSIFWMVLPSLFFFAAFPFFAKLGLRFYPSLALSCISTAGVYWGYLRALGALGIRL